MAYVNGTTHYNLPQTVGTDKRDWADTNEAFAAVDAALYSATEDVADAQTEINGLKERMTTAEGNINTNTNDISALDGRLTTAEGTITQHTAQIADVRQDVEDMICAYNEASATSTHAYAIGDYFIYNDVLYRAIQPISIGHTIVPDTNCTTTNVSSELLTKAVKPSELTYYGSNYATIANMIAAIRADIIAISGYTTKKIDLYWSFGGTYATPYHLSQVYNTDPNTTTNAVLYFSSVVGTPSNMRCRYITANPDTATQGEYQITTSGTTSSTVDVTDAPMFNVKLVVG